MTHAAACVAEPRPAHGVAQVAIITRGTGMGRLSILIVLAAALAGCVPPPRYSFQGATVKAADRRADQYCGKQGADARLRHIQPKPDANPVEVYRCRSPR